MTSIALSAVAVAAIVTSYWTRGEKTVGLWLLALFAIIGAGGQ